LLFRKSYKPKRLIRFRPGLRATLVFRPSRAGPENASALINTETASRTISGVALLD
jgi:hypothetical protein